jgi:hypothetical protein
VKKIIKIAIIFRYIGIVILIYAITNIPLYIINYYQFIKNTPLDFKETLPFLFGWIYIIIRLFLNGFLFIGGSQFILLTLKKWPSLAFRK